MLASLLRAALGAQIVGAALFGYWLSGAVLGALVCALLLPPLGCAWAIGVTVLMSRAPQESAALWLRSLWGEIGASMRMFLLRQPWTTAPPVCLLANGPATQAHKVPVLLVHGFICNHRIWDDATAALRADGHAVRTVNLEPVFGSIDDYATTVEAAVADLCQHTGATQVALVGHSMGGLAIRAWMRTHGTQRVARVLTLGTPHAGTQLASWVSLPWMTNGQQMLWQSPWLAALAQSETEAVRALMHIAITPQDNIVYPQRAQVLPGVPVTVFEGMGHLQLCLEKPVLDWLVQQLSPLPLR